MYNRFGDPILCIGATFTVSKKHGKKFQYYREIETGKILSIAALFILILIYIYLCFLDVLKNIEDNTIYFQFYNIDDFSDAPPPINDSESLYMLPIVTMMSTSEKITGIHWTVKSSSNVARNPRIKKRTWEFVPREKVPESIITEIVSESSDNDNDISATTSDEEDLEEKIKNSSTILLSEVSGYEDSDSDIDARKK